MAEIGVFEAIHTTRAIRRYKTDPVPREQIHQILDAAIRGPSAVNRQPWRYLVVTDAGLRKQIADLYHQAWQAGLGDPARAATRAQYDPAILSHADEFSTKQVFNVPAFIFVFATEAGAHDSVLQGVQNMALAARGLGLGTLFTTLLRRSEAEVKRILGVPDGAEFVCMLPVGYPDAKFGPVRRLPVEEVTYAERWGKAWGK